MSVDSVSGRSSGRPTLASYAAVSCCRIPTSAGLESGVVDDDEGADADIATGVDESASLDGAVSFLSDATWSSFLSAYPYLLWVPVPLVGRDRRDCSSFESFFSSASLSSASTKSEMRGIVVLYEIVLQDFLEKKGSCGPRLALGGLLNAQLNKRGHDRPDASVSSINAVK